MTARRIEKLQAIKQNLLESYPKALIHTVQLDVTNTENIRKAIEQLPQEFKKIDILVNNAGLVIGTDHVSDISHSALNTIIDTNVKGLLFVTQQILPIMKENKSGHIINIGSIAGKETYPGGGVYAASKHAVNAITRTLRMELLDTPIRVSEVNPGELILTIGLVETEFSLVRFSGNAEAAKNVYNGLDPLKGQDIAEIVTFIASRPPHVQIADIVVFPTNQASVLQVHRDPK